MKRPYLQFSVPSLEVFIDEKGWLPTFNRIFYELPFPEFPFKFPGKGFFIANGWCNGEGAFVQNIKLLEPTRDKVLVASGSRKFELKNSDTSYVAVNFFQDVEFGRPGIYWIQVLLNEELMLEYPMLVREADTGKSKSREPQAMEKPGEPKKQEPKIEIKAPETPKIEPKAPELPKLEPKFPDISIKPDDDMGIIAPG